MKKSLLGMFALAALVGCTQNEIPDEQLAGGDEQVTICLKSVTHLLEANTRAPFIGGIGSGNVLTAKVLLTKTSGGFIADSNIESGKMTFSGNGDTELWNSKNYYPADNLPVYLCGLYPDDTDVSATKWGAGADKSAMTYVFDGKTDVMAAAQVATTKTAGQEGTYQTLSFDHLLTNLIIKAEPDLSEGVTAANIQTVWGKITGIELQTALGSAPKNKVTVTLATGASAFATDGSYGVKFYTASGKNYPGASVTEPFAFDATELTSAVSKLIPETATAVAYSMIAPIDATGTNDFTLLVKTEQRKSGVPVSVNLSTAGSTKGKYCIVTLKFMNTTIQAKASVKDWGEGSVGLVPVS